MLPPGARSCQGVAGCVFPCSTDVRNDPSWHTKNLFEPFRASTAAVITWEL